MHIARMFATVLFVASVPVFLVLSNVRVAAMEPRVYGYSFGHYGVPITTGIDRPQLDAAARDIVLYFQDARPLLTTQVSLGGQEGALFSAKEALHMRDVKALFGHVFFVHDVALAYIVGYIVAVFLWSHERSLRTLARQLALAGTLTVSVLAAFAVISLFGFDRLFLEFHVLSFANDFWELDPASDHLIQMFPRDFWYAVTMAVGFATIVEGALVALCGYTLRAWLDRPLAPRAPVEADAAPAHA